MQSGAIFFRKILFREKGMFHQKMAIRPLKHPRTALFFQIAAKQIYFLPSYIKGGYLEYQKLQGQDGD